MSQISDVYITRSNFSKLANSTAHLQGDIAEIFAGVYEHRNLREYLNNPEIEEIERKRILLENSGKCIAEYLAKQRSIDSTAKALARFSRYVFVSNAPPKFHKNSACKFLTKDYVNYYIPPEIEAQGVAEIQRFREFAIINKGLLEDGREDVFIQRLKSAFRLEYDLSKINFSNSGVDRFDTGPSEESEVVKRIDGVLNSIETSRETDEGASAFKNFRYLTHFRTRSVIGNEAALKLLRLKSELVELLVKFHLTRFSKTGFSFDAKLLEALGFESCKACGN